MNFQSAPRAVWGRTPSSRDVPDNLDIAFANAVHLVGLVHDRIAVRSDQLELVADLVFLRRRLPYQSTSGNEPSFLINHDGPQDGQKVRPPAAPTITRRTTPLGFGYRGQVRGNIFKESGVMGHVETCMSDSGGTDSIPSRLTSSSLLISNDRNFEPK